MSHLENTRFHELCNEIIGCLTKEYGLFSEMHDTGNARQSGEISDKVYSSRIGSLLDQIDELEEESAELWRELKELLRDDAILRNRAA